MVIYIKIKVRKGIIPFGLDYKLNWGPSLKGESIKLNIHILAFSTVIVKTVSAFDKKRGPTVN
jgi:hypothetical protein